MAEAEYLQEVSSKHDHHKEKSQSFTEMASELLHDAWNYFSGGRKDNSESKSDKGNSAPKSEAADKKTNSPKDHDHPSFLPDAKKASDDEDDDDEKDEGGAPRVSGEHKFVSTAPRPEVENNPNFPNLKIYFGALHGHSVYSDGMSKPSELYQSGKEQNMDFVAVTDHSHDDARRGVKPDNPRHAEQEKVPVLSKAPQLYNSTFHDAKEATQDGKFVGLNGVEMGTIGKPGAKTQDGVNHINIFEVEAFIQSVKGGRTPKRTLETGHVPEENQFPKPEVWKIKDGDYKALVERLDKTTDSTGGRPVIQLNHPRWSQDESPSLNESVRGRDFGQKSFDSQDEWRERFGKYASLLEVISGEALHQDQSGEFDSHHIHAVDFAGYIEKGLHVSPTFGRDSHYDDPGGTPAATGILANGLDKKSLLDGMRERRTFATTGRDSLAGYSEVNNKHLMGSIVDQNDSPNVHVTMTVASEVQPEAQYTVILWADQNIGDGELAEKVQTIHIAGNKLIANNRKVNFDELPHVVGNKSAYYVEVQKRNNNHTDRMWTAPVWVEPKN